LDLEESMAASDIVENHIRAFNNHDAAAWASHYTEDAALHDPQYPEPVRGRAGIQKDIEDFFSAFPDMEFRIVGTVASEDRAAVQGIGIGTHRGALETPGGSIEPTNKRVEVPFAAFVVLSGDGLITEERRYYDLAGMLSQLGLMGDPSLT
jgi:steroid delta-isomerase-like uncharacterized protein